ncbi:uncharacterized protein LOC117790379 [Drosophila innubila]|uniref:uncharacterized protein LOC117790379 n=1 Tax=Drosophila innubila TaxID=198719 RepID=UPI00148BFF49|nr:uncharacterized protein LOC117790379 [Drosophila innubila]
MHRSSIHESSSDAEELSHTDYEDNDHTSYEQKQDDNWQDEYNKEPKQKINSLPYGYASDNSNDSLYNRCWQRAEHYVQDFIKEQDAANDKFNEPKATLSSRRKMHVPKFEEEKTENYQRISSRKSQQIDCNDRSDTESQLSPSSSDESKTYSQVYSEIFEESKARQKKAEKIRRVYNNNNNRTQHWVEHIGEYDMDDCTTEASDRSDKESEENFKESENELDYETLIKEQLDVIDQYQNDPLGSFRSCIEEYMFKIDKARSGKEKQTTSARRSEEKTKESNATDRSTRSNLISIKSYAQSLDSEGKSSERNSVGKCLVDNDLNVNSTEILHFEHCEIYHVKRPIKDLEPRKFHSNDNKNIPNEEIFSNRSRYSLVKDCREFSNNGEREDRKQNPTTNSQFSDESNQNVERNSEHFVEQIEEEKSQDTNQSADNSYQLEAKSFVEDWKSQSKISDISESSEKKSYESETSSNHIKVQKSLRTRHRLNKSERASNNSHKSHHLPTTSSPSSRIRSPYEDSSDSTNNYYLSSKSLTSSSSHSQNSSKRSRNARSLIITPKTYEDRACSPIKIKSSRQTNQKIRKQSESVGESGDTDDDDNHKITESSSSSSSKAELKQQYSQVSINSEDKGLQYPSDDELQDSIKSPVSNKMSVPCFKVYDLDKALLEVPSDLKGNAIMFDNEDELLNISLSDDELQMQAKLQAAILSDRKKDISSRNSSYNSIPSADRSSICSISSYEPSERFYRRTQAEVDDDDNPIEDADDSEPMTYKKHVSRLAERTLRACTNYYNEGIKLKPELDQELNEKVQMLYNSEMRFNTVKRQKQRDDLLKEFNEKLQRQLKSIAPRLQ